MISIISSVVSTIGMKIQGTWDAPTLRGDYSTRKIRITNNNTNNGCVCVYVCNKFVEFVCTALKLNLVSYQLLALYAFGSKVVVLCPCKKAKFFIVKIIFGNTVDLQFSASSVGTVYSIDMQRKN